MKIIITEQQVGLYSALRRRDEMWNIVQHSFPYMYPCDFSRDEIVEAVSGEIWDVIASDWMIYSHRKEYQEFVRIYFKDEILNYWDTKCGSDKK